MVASGIELQNQDLNGLSLRIEFLLDQNHGQIGPLCLEKRSNSGKN